MRKAASSLRAFRSLRLVFTMSITCLRVTFPTLVLLGSFDPAAMLAAFFKRIAAGGLLGMECYDFYLKNLISNGRKFSFCFSWGAFNFFQKALLFIPAGPQPVPTAAAASTSP